MKRILLTLLLILNANSTYSLDPNGFEQITHLGYVYARAIVKDENSGLPLWAEYNEQGGHTKLDVDLAEANDGQVVSGATYRSYATALESFKVQYEGYVEVLSKEEYLGKIDSFTTINGQPIVNLSADIHDSILTIAIPAKEKRFQVDGARIEKLLLPVDLIAHPNVSESTNSILIAKDGRFLAESRLRIGYLTAFNRDENGQVPDVTEYEPASSYQFGSRNIRDFLDPIPNVYIETAGANRNAKVLSGEDGFYRAQAFPVPCPGFIYHPQLYATARLYYANFHPRGNPAIPYWLEATSYNSCNGLALLLQSSGNLLGLMAAVSIQAIVASSPENIHRIDYPVAINVIGGLATMYGATVSEKTTYRAEESPLTEYMAPNDFDGDGEFDSYVRGQYNDEGMFEANPDGKYYGVFLSGKESNGQPDFVRVMDVLPDFKHKGFVETISEDDLKDTDILVFRESTGELITERNGFTDEEMDRRRLGRTDINDNSVAYSMAIRSVEDFRSVLRKYSRGGFSDWQATNSMNPALHNHKSDFLRNGEVLRIVAINRATGYMGTSLTRMSAARDGGDITVYVPPIVMTPPNLKVWATRRYQPQGLEKNAERERHTISNEGAATTDDYVIEVHTKWMDTNGLPLPPGLNERGYTGRLVKVASDPNSSSNPYSTQVSEFSINPGTELQVIKFGEGEAGKYHYHLQVNGQTEAESNDFASGSHEGVLRHRPNKYVPIAVPLYNEVISNLNEITQKEAVGEEFEDVEPAFDWVYRPELSFSVVDLEVDAANRYDDQTKLNNIMDDNIPAIASSDSALELLYSLVGSEFDRITPLDSEQTFVFAFGEEEVEITVEKGTAGKTNIQFQNVDHLAEIEPEDFLSLRLYLNEDSQNVLWSYSFEYLYVDSRKVDHDLEEEDIYYISADDPVVPLYAALIGYAGRDDDDKEPRTIRWITDNGNYSDSQLQTDSENGTFANDLTMPRVAGEQAHVKVRLQNSQTEAKFKTIQVVAGAPASISLTPVVGDRPGVMGTKNFTIEAFVRDAHGNVVQDGTPVDFSIQGYANVVSQDVGTTAGRARLTVTGSERYDGNLKLIAESGSANDVYDSSIAELNIDINIPTDLHVRRQYDATITVTDEDGSKLNNLPVVLSSPHLAIVSGDEIVTDANGQAHIRIQTPTVPILDTYLHARVGYAGAARLPMVVRNVVGQQETLVAENFQPLLGEYTENGAFAYTRYDDADVNFAYNTHKKLTLKGDANSSQTLKIGDAYGPNNMPIFSLGLNAETSLRAGLDPNQPTEEVTFDDDTSSTKLRGKSFYLAPGTAQGSGASVRFDASSEIKSTNVSHLFTQSPNWAFDLKPTSSGGSSIIVGDGGSTSSGNLIELGSGQYIELTSDGVLRYTVETDTGTHQVEYPGIQTDKWSQVAARIYNGQLELYVDDFAHPVTAPVSGTILYPGNQLKIGQGFEGQLSNLRLYDLDSAPLLRIVQGDTIGEGADNSATPVTEQAITLDATGSYVAQIISTGLMNQGNEKLDILYINAHAGDTHLHVPLMSEEGFKNIAARAADIGAVGPPIVFTRYDANGQPIIRYADTSDPWKSLPLSSVINSSHAFDLISLLDFVIPITSILDIADQISKIGTEEFNPILLIVSGLDVALSFSGPLKPFIAPVFKPLKRLAANPVVSKFVKILAPVFGNAADKAIKSKSLKPIKALLPFLLIIGEIAADEDAREAIPIIVDAISSSEDMQIWFDYFSLPTEAWEGTDIPDLELFPGTDPIAANDLPLSSLMNSAYAAGKKFKRTKGPDAAEDLKKAFKDLKSGDKTPEEVAQSFTRAMGELIHKARTEGVTVRGIVRNMRALTATAALGTQRYIRNLLDSSKTARTPIFLQLAAVAYLESQITEGIIKDDFPDKIRKLYAKAFAAPLVLGYDNPRVAGYQFQLTMTALMHLWGNIGGSTYGKLIDIEKETPIILSTYTTNGKVKEFTDKSFSRDIDLVFKSGDDKPIHMELKSYKGREGSNFKPTKEYSGYLDGFSQWNFSKKGSGSHRQYILDRITETKNTLIEDSELQQEANPASKIYWRFQDYKQKTRFGLSESQVNKVREYLSKNAKGDSDVIKASLGIKEGVKYDAKKEETEAKNNNRIELFNFKTVLEDSSSNLVKELFDESTITPELQEKIKTLIFDNLP